MITSNTIASAKTILKYIVINHNTNYTILHYTNSEILFKKTKRCRDFCSFFRVVLIFLELGKFVLIQNETFNLNVLSYSFCRNVIHIALVFIESVTFFSWSSKMSELTERPLVLRWPEPEPNRSSESSDSRFFRFFEPFRKWAPKVAPIWLKFSG
jgi:hypothetical protein